MSEQPRARRLRTAALVCHAALAAAVAAAAITLSDPPLGRALALLAALLPLAAVTPGLLYGRRNAYAYGSLILVLYVGVAATEVVASASRFSPAALAMLLALIELARVLLASPAFGESAALKVPGIPAPRNCGQTTPKPGAERLGSGGAGTSG